MMQKKTIIINTSKIHRFFEFMGHVKENIAIILFFLVPLVSAFVAVVAFLVSINTSSIVKKLDAHESRIVSLEQA